VTSGKLDVAEAMDGLWEVVDFSGESLCSLDTCHHLDASQN